MPYKQILSTVATVAVLKKFQLVEKVPVGFIQNNAGLVEVALGAAAVGGIIMKKVDSPMLKGVATGLIVDGAIKMLDKYLP